MAQLEIAADGAAAQVEIAVFHAQVIAAVSVVFDGERGDVADIQNLKAVGDDLDVACGNFGIFRRAFGYCSRDLNDKLAPEAVGFVVESGVFLVVEDNLCYSVAVAEVYEGHSSHLSGALDPTGEGHAVSGVAQTQFAACVSSIHSDI